MSFTTIYLVKGENVYALRYEGTTIRSTDSFEFDENGEFVGKSRERYIFEDAIDKLDKTDDNSILYAKAAMYNSMFDNKSDISLMQSTTSEGGDLLFEKLDACIVGSAENKTINKTTCK